MEDIHVTIGGKRWRLAFVSRLPDGADGDCDGPQVPNKTMRIKRSLADKKKLEVILHESLHAADWHRSEEWVHETAEDLTRILWRLGWRPTDG